MPIFPELVEPLSDGSVVVRFGAERDIPEVLIAYQDDPQLHLRMAQARPPSGAELGRRAERAAADRVTGRRLTMTIVQADDDTCVGQVYVDPVDWDNARADLGIWVAPERRGGGMGRRALALVAGWLLGECGFQRVQIVTEPGNEQALRAARAAGFSLEGVLRAHTRARGSRADAAVLSLVRRDLPG